MKLVHDGAGGFLRKLANLKLDAEDTAVAGSADGLVVEISNSSAGNTLVALQSGEFLAVIVEIGLELVVNLLAVGGGQSLLLLVVAVSEIVASAAWEEVESQWLIWSLGASVGGPVERSWPLGVASAGEGRQAGLEEEAVGGSLCGLAGLELVKLLGGWRAGDEERERKGQGLSKPDEGEESESEVELHVEGQKKFGNECVVELES